MGLKFLLEESNRPEPTLHEELGALGDDDLMEFMNLTTRQTGIDGIVFVSTELGRHGPRVKYFVKPGRDQPSYSISIEEKPRLLSNSLPERVMKRTASSVVDWVRLNKDTLLDFWRNGESWTDDEVTAFKAALKKIS